MRALSKTNLADTAVEAIRTEILEHRWTVGEKLPNEAALSAMLSVSRGTVREAVRVLVSQGYLETRQGSGTYVLSTADSVRPLGMARRAGLRDQFEARLALDAEAARLAALRHTPAVIAGLRALLAARGDYGSGDKAGFIARDFAFHQAVVAASQNVVLIGMYDFFSTLIAETIDATLGQELPEPDMAAHVAIVDAIESGSPDAADAAVRRFMAPVLSALDRLLMS
ncbi:FadR/GntR family transcriptional regulator [Shinella sp. JR1-6]|jgi:DNA-binding FadR family transcriptional regulator|uniref:FadR/GntR family transcriptional regulator n=1 Tax=Shinella sp. JR1-6 TaxID=2527671 RepID=UPI00102D668D|nr:FadR/GntR family transcriptional regulator [Shinella sp. JR1-6]TAA57507.1 FadR family transcriptional regulator [Shinella sp. JR1-6]